MEKTRRPLSCNHRPSITKLKGRGQKCDSSVFFVQKNDLGPDRKIAFQKVWTCGTFWKVEVEPRSTRYSDPKFVVAAQRNLQRRQVILQNSDRF